MHCLAIVDPVTLEPLAVYRRDARGLVDSAGESTGTATLVEDPVGRFIAGTATFAGGDSLDAGLLEFHTDTPVSAADVLVSLRAEWDTRGTRLRSEFAFTPVFASTVCGPDVTSARAAFTAHLVGQVLRAAGVHDVEPFVVEQRLSTITPMFRDAADDTLFVTVAPFEYQHDAALALAYGLTYAGDRELVLVLPAHLSGPSLRRCAFLDVPVRVIAYETRTVLGRWYFTARELVVPSQPEVRASYGDSLVTTEHELGERAAWVTPLLDWAATRDDLTPAHRDSYLAWHCLGRLVLQIRRARAGLTVLAGVNASKPSDVFPGAERVDLVAPISPEQLDTVRTAAEVAITNRLNGLDTGHAEHLLQSLLADQTDALGLRTDPGAVQREFPAIRADETRGFLDFLGVDDHDRLHIVETKIGSDAMLVLQALEYWIWATAHAEQLAALFGLATKKPEIVVDFVVAGKGNEPPIGPYTAAEADALPGALQWRCYVASGWEQHQLHVQPVGTHTWPEAPRFGPRRYATELQAHLADPAHAPGPLVAGALLADPSANVVPAARWAVDQLADRHLLHRFARHVRSSQAFALNLFAPLDRAAVGTLLDRWFDDVVEADPPSFEWTDRTDRLAESSAPRPHRTQVDVVLRGRTSSGATVAAFVEVKLSEIDFSACSAFQSPNNDTRHVCAAAGAFGGDADACFQLRNHGGPHRRHYDEHLPPLGEVAGVAGCWFRGGLNQPMRNVALLDALLADGTLADGVYVLCAPADNRGVHRTWARARELFGSRLHTLDPAEVLALQPEGTAKALAGRYALILAAPSGDEESEPAGIEFWPAKPLRELLSWRIASELVMRHPRRFVVIETHPGGGQYDCLALYEVGRPTNARHVDINREGSVHVLMDTSPDFESLRDVWEKLVLGRLSVADAADFVDRYLPRPDTPPVNAGAPDHDLAVEIISATAALLDPTRNWTWRNGMDDTSGWLGGPRDAWFGAFPTARASRAIPGNNDMLGEPAYRFWFLLRDEEPVLCIETTGTAHTRSGTTVRLRDLGQSSNVIAARLHDEQLAD